MITNQTQTVAGFVRIQTLRICLAELSRVQLRLLSGWTLTSSATAFVGHGRSAHPPVLLRPRLCLGRKVSGSSASTPSGQPRNGSGFRHASKQRLRGVRSSASTRWTCCGSGASGKFRPRRSLGRS